VSKALQRAEQLFRLASDPATSEQEARTAAVTLVRLMRKEGFVVRASARAEEQVVRGHARPRTTPRRPTSFEWSADDPVSMNVHVATVGEWALYVAGMFFVCPAPQCGRGIPSGELFVTHGRIGVRCLVCAAKHGMHGLKDWARATGRV
jgi:hypothetical protein